MHCYKHLKYGDKYFFLFLGIISAGNYAHHLYFEFYDHLVKKIISFAKNSGHLATRNQKKMIPKTLMFMEIKTIVEKWVSLVSLSNSSRLIKDHLG